MINSRLRLRFAFSQENKNTTPYNHPLPNTDLSGWAQELSSRVKCFLFEKYLSLPTHGCPRASRNIPAISTDGLLSAQHQRFFMNKTGLFGDFLSFLVCQDVGQCPGRCCRGRHSRGPAAGASGARGCWHHLELSSVGSRSVPAGNAAAAAETSPPPCLARPGGGRSGVKGRAREGGCAGRSSDAAAAAAGTALESPGGARPGVWGV